MNFTFEGHTEARRRGIRVLNHEELQAGDVSLEYVSRLMHRRYTDSPTLRKILQTLWYQVNNGQEIYVIGVILDDGTVRGGTGWGAEFAKLCNKPLCVFDQEKDGWFEWTGSGLEGRGDDAPRSPTRTSPAPARARSTTTASDAIEELFTNSFETLEARTFDVGTAARSSSSIQRVSAARAPGQRSMRASTRADVLRRLLVELRRLRFLLQPRLLRLERLDPRRQRLELALLLERQLARVRRRRLRRARPPPSVPESLVRAPASPAAARAAVRLGAGAAAWRR